MRTRDFREILADDLQDPDFRREYVIACYEQDGIDGLQMAFDEIARADTERSAKSVTATVKPFNSLPDLRTLLNQIGLDIHLVPLHTAGKTLTSV